MKCFLHIGIEKTGTTAIQFFLYHNRSKLLEEGYCIFENLGVGNNLDLVKYAIKKDKVDGYIVKNHITNKEAKSIDREILKKFKSEIVSKKSNIAIISSEHFHSRCTEIDEIRKLKSLLDEYFNRTKVIVYLRPQVEVATSLYTTVLKSGSISRFDNFIKNHCVAENPYYNYKTLLDQWSSIFGKENIILKIYEKKRLLNSNIIDDFLLTIGIKNLEKFDTFLELNESITPFGQELIRLNNKFNVFDKNEFVNFISSIYKGKGSTLGKTIAQKIQSQFQKINEQVSNEWYDKKDLFTIDYDRYNNNIISDEEKKLLGMLFSKINELNIDDAVKLRDSALVFEKKGDLTTAYALMKEAHKLRPNGPFIRQKIDAYQKILGKTHDKK